MFNKVADLAMECIYMVMIIMISVAGVLAVGL